LGFIILPLSFSSLRVPTQSGRGNLIKLNKPKKLNERKEPNKLISPGVLTNLAPDSRLFINLD